MFSFRKTLFAALTLAVVATPVKALAQNSLNTQDIKYLAELDLILLNSEKYDFTPFVEKLSKEIKLEDGKGICERIRSGISWDDHLLYLFSEAFRDEPALEQDILREYTATAWFVGVQNYCPEYSYQIRSQE